jgi:hypothetical protein
MLLLPYGMVFRIIGADLDFRNSPVKRSSVM